MTTFAVVATSLGLLVLVWAVWERRGASRNARAWTLSKSKLALRTTLLIRPGLGAFLLGVGLFPLVEQIPGLSQAIGVVALGGLAVMFWGILDLPYPGWVVPSYAREHARRVRERRWE